MTEQRPDPDRLLAVLEREREQATRGRLKIFFGACAGVGKTYAMLSTVRQKMDEGNDVLIGLVETHGRSETAALLEDMPILPQREVQYRGHTLREFDLDTALMRKPSLIVVDELAHTNVEGSRHRKRWQDVEELLAAGIDVWTALNVQHLESLNDVVGSITGIRVRETVPDRIYEAADEVSLVDLPPAELQSRLKAGKVYLADAAERAAENFFRTGNLIALRELALRRTADRVDAQMRAYRADRAIERVWQTRDRLVVCIGAGVGGEILVRHAARMAGNLQAEWIAVTVETPEMASESETRRSRRMQTLKLAASLGAEVCTLAAVDEADSLLRFAINRNVGRLILGRTRRNAWQRLFRPSLLDRLIKAEQGPELVVVGLQPGGQEREDAPDRRIPIQWQGYIWSFFICAATTAFASTLISVFDLANVVMVFLLAVVGVALRFGRGPGALAACLSVAAFDYFFVPPRLTFSVNDTQYVFTFVLMLLVALVIGQLAAKLKFEAFSAATRENRSIQQAELSRALSAALTTEQIIDIALQHLAGIFQSRISILLPDAHGRIRPVIEDNALDDPAVAQWVYDHEQSAGLGTATLPATPARYLPLRAPMRVRGVLGILPGKDTELDAPETLRQLEICISQIAQALERVHYVEVAQDALVSMESERLRNSLLAAISHDLRTPLTGLIGMADTLATNQNHPTKERDMILGIRATAHRLVALVTNLLDMARLQTGRIQLKRDWCAIEEVIETSTRQLAIPLAEHPLETHIEADLPLCEFDPVLIERVMVNLLDNAAKYTPATTPIQIYAEIANHCLQVRVEDQGPGLPSGSEERLFTKFERGSTLESAQPGVGLGLAICRAIINAHGGKITARNRPDGGACFCFQLPLGKAPNTELETP